MRILSPCCRQCCLNQQDICLGCARTLQEILDWSSMDDSERNRILKCVAQRKVKLNILPITHPKSP